MIMKVHESVKMKKKTCFVFSGNPLPRLTWYKSGSLIDETYDILSNGTVRNEITFHSIERSFLRTKLTCEASNTNLTRPTSTTVNVDMNCKFYKTTVAAGHNQMLWPLSCQKKVGDQKWQHSRAALCVSVLGRRSENFHI